MKYTHYDFKMSMSTFFSSAGFLKISYKTNANSKIKNKAEFEFSLVTATQVISMFALLFLFFFKEAP